MSKTPKTKRGRPRENKPIVPATGLRIPADVRALIDAEVKRINATTPGAAATLTSVIVASVRAHCGGAP